MQSDALGPVDPNERVEVSVIVKPRHPLGELEARLDKPMSREEFAASYGADPDDLANVERFAREHGLDVIESSQPRRTVRLGGRAADVAGAFGVSLQRRRLPDGTEFRAADGPVQIPSDLEGTVEGVFGLDTRPVASPRE
jgi:kumamolisin